MHKPPPLLGYNTNVRHHGNLFHIQTEDSGVEHPHIITHLFVEGTILATKKCSYADALDTAGWEAKVRSMMKDQHKAMFIELRDGMHDAVADRIFAARSKRAAGPEPAGSDSEGQPVEADAGEAGAAAGADIPFAEDESTPAPPENVVPIRPLQGPGYYSSTSTDPHADKAVRVIRPAQMAPKREERTSKPEEAAHKTAATLRQRSIFDTPDDDGEFGENLITDKSLDEVILSYLTDELDE